MVGAGASVFAQSLPDVPEFVGRGLGALHDPHHGWCIQRSGGRCEARHGQPGQKQRLHVGTLDHHSLQGLSRGRSIELNAADIEYLEENATTLLAVAPRNQLGGWRGGDNVTHGVKTAACGVYGDVPVYKDIDPIVIMQGRYINQRDLDDRRKVAVIGGRVRQLLFDKNEKVLGSHIQVQGVTFTVVGVYRSQQTGKTPRKQKTRFSSSHHIQPCLQHGGSGRLDELADQGRSSRRHRHGRSDALVESPKERAP